MRLTLAIVLTLFVCSNLLAQTPGYDRVYGGFTTLNTPISKSVKKSGWDSTYVGKDYSKVVYVVFGSSTVGDTLIVKLQNDSTMFGLLANHMLQFPQTGVKYVVYRLSSGSVSTTSYARISTNAIISDGARGAAPIGVIQQTQITGFVDTVGTASTYWQTLDLKTTGPQGIEVINLGADTLLCSADTTTNGLRKIYPYTMFQTVNLWARYLYIKAKTTSCMFHAGNF